MHDFREFMAGILACEQEDLPPDSTPLRSLEGWDSLKHVLLVVGLENKLNAKLTAEEIQGIVTLADVACALKEKSTHPSALKQTVASIPLSLSGYPIKPGYPIAVAEPNHCVSWGLPRNQIVPSNDLSARR